MENEPGINRRGLLKKALGAVAAATLGVMALLYLKKSAIVKRPSSNIDQPDRIDPSLIQYEQSGKPIATGLSESRAIAVDSTGLIHVAGDKTVRVFDQSGKLLKENSLSGSPRSLFLTDQDLLYVAMTDHIEVFDKQYRQIANWKSFGRRSFLTSIAVSEDHVFVADAGNRIVVHCDSTGKVLNYIGKRDKDRGIPGFHVPSPYFGLAVAPDGLLRVVNPGRHRIEAYTFDGDFEFAWGERAVRIDGFCGCCNPVSFAILPDERFVTCEKGLLRVKVYEPDGTFKAVVAGPDQLAQGRIRRVCTSPAKCGTGGFGVTTDEEGRVFVLDTIKNLVRIFAET
ncbi:hypothetical protein LCGC14_2032920 [marine sediment metagenome]|uniref:SMP-30/Gluconolactonase/LRE-like region domain-containing protein n=1 Tax=marine sediment metagenome TaxID=412755 RepID=A0A0F9H7L6_9ZZZZ